MTALEYLVDLLETQKFITKSQIFIATEMEKKQIIEAFEEGMFHHVNGMCPDEYYNEKFNLQA